MLKPVLLTFLTSILITLGQICWKFGLIKTGGLYLKEQGLFENMFRLLSNWQIISGFALYIIATGFFMYLLQEFEISLVIPLSSISFIFSLIAGKWFFHENVNYWNWIGVLVIIIGIVFISKK